MTTRDPVTHSGGSSHPLQPNGMYIGRVETKFSNVRATVKIASLGNIVIGPCRAVDGLQLAKNRQVLCCFLDGRMDQMVIIGTLAGAWWHSHPLPVAPEDHTH